MAQNAPNCKDTQEVQFKLHDKFVAFKNCGDLRSNVNLLAVSSSRGLLFAGHPSAPELKVIIIKDVAAAKMSGKQPQARTVPLPNIPNYMSCSSDGNLLAINFTQSNGTSMLLIYGVQSFMTPEVRILYNIRLAPEDFVHAVQLLWNPVLPNSLAVVLSNGGLGMYALKDGGNFELHSLDKSQQVKCGCWSPKGKQLVLGFPSGRLQQFKPDLTPAKTLACPPNIHDAPFDTIALHWLSTFQFAVIFLQHGEDCNPKLYIINAPKAGTPTYTNYYDICYSLNGPRNHQFNFTHIPQWNLLLVSSANGVEVGVLGTSETGDLPTWQQLTLLDEARIELPLSEDTQDETFPLGFAYDTSSTHQLTLNEKQLPSMPMVHVLGTDGTLLAFDFLNLQPGVPSVCSPPPPLADTSGKFCALDTLTAGEEKITAGAAAAAVAPPPVAAVQATTPALADISFAFTPNTVTSTPAPAKDKPPSLFAGFGNMANKAPPSFAAPPSTSLNFGTAPPAKPASNLPATGFGGFGAASAPTTAVPAFALPTSSFANVPVSKTEPTVAAPSAVPSASTFAAASAVAPLKTVNNNNSIGNKPLYTVPPTFTPVAAAPAAAAQPAQGKNSEFSAREVDDVIGEIMNVQISAFSEQIEQQKKQTQALLAQIELPSSIKFYAKRLDDLQELNDQANDVDFELDVQSLRHGLSEAYTMMAECRAKLEVYKNPDITRLMSSTSFDAAGLRLLTRLQSYLAANEAQMQLAQQHIDTQWEQYQDMLRRNSKAKMHMPCLEGIYQRLTRLQNMASDQRITQTNIKAKLKERGLLQAALLNQENNRQRTNEAVDSLADSILSLTVNQSVEANRAKLSQQKLQSIRQLLHQHKIHVISPQRPDRVGLKSEVILETKLKAELKKKTAAAASAAAASKPTVAHKATQAATALAKPTASKPAAPSEASNLAAPVSTPLPAPASFNFSQSSPFVKTTATTVTTATISAAAGLGEATAKPATSFFGSVPSFNFGQTAGTAAAPAFGGFGGATKPAQEQPKKDAPVPVESVKPSTTATVINSNASKSASSSSNQATAKVDPVSKTFSFANFNTNSGAPIGSIPFGFGGFGSFLGNSASPKSPAVVGTASTSASTPTAIIPPTSSQETVSSTNSSGGSTSSTASSVIKVTTNTAPQPVVSVSSTVKPATASSAAPVSTTSTFTAPTSTPASFSFGAPTSTPAPTSAPALTPTTATTITAEPIESPFASVNICKPQTKDPSAVSSAANIFSGFGGGAIGASVGSNLFGGDASKNLFGGVAASTATVTAASPITTTTTTTAATTTAAPTSSAATVTTVAPVSAPTTATATVAAATMATATTPASTTSASTSAATVVPVPASTTSQVTTPGSSFNFSNAFNSLSTVGTTASSTTSSAPTSIFGGANVFAATATAGSPFQTAATPTANIFGNVPKPEASVFGATAASATAPPTGLFASAAVSSFGGSPAAAAPPAATSASSGGNIFGQAAATSVKPSIFGSPAPATAASAASGGSIFGGSSTTSSPFGGGSIFGGTSTSAQNSPAAGSSGSIFGQSVFGGGASASTSGGNIFGNAAAGTQPQASGFGGGSVFGGAATTASSPAASGGSIFGGASSSGGFGSFSQTTPTPGSFGGGFAQTSGASVAHTGFGSPQQQTQQSPAGGFGAKPVFGGSPAFGASPTFGGAPTFGSPKGFGSFGNTSGVVSPPAFGAAPKAPEGNIFEQLGGTDTGLSFGNLAQTNNANNQKSTFGGSSFMTYR